MKCRDVEETIRHFQDNLKPTQSVEEAMFHMYSCRQGRCTATQARFKRHCPEVHAAYLLHYRTALASRETRATA